MIFADIMYSMCSLERHFYAKFTNFYFFDVVRHLLFNYTGGKNVWGDRPFYLVKQPQEKWACDFHDDAPPLSFQLQVAEVIF